VDETRGPACGEAGVAGVDEQIGRERTGRNAAADESHNEMLVRPDGLGEADRRTNFGAGEVVEGKPNENDLMLRHRTVCRPARPDGHTRMGCTAPVGRVVTMSTPRNERRLHDWGLPTREGATITRTRAPRQEAFLATRGPPQRFTAAERGRQCGSMRFLRSAD